MKSVALLPVSLLLVAVMLLNTGCMSTPDGRKTQAQGTAIGAVGGALLGGLLGAATGNRDNIARFAVIGAAAGGAAGFAYGTAVAKRKAKYAGAEQWLNEEIAIAHSTNSRAYAYNASLRRRIASLESRAAVAKRTGNRAESRAVKAAISQIRNEAAQQNKSDSVYINEHNQVLGDAQARSAANYSAYQREVNTYNQAKAERGQLLGRVASLDNSLDR